MKAALSVLACAAVALPALAQGPGSTPAALTLADAIARAQATDAAPLIAGNSVMRAEAGRSEAAAALLPRLDAQAFESRQTRNLKSQGLEFPGVPALIGPFNTFDARLSLSQTIFDARSFLAARGARLGPDIARAQAAVAREQAASRAILGYIAVLRAQEAVGAAESDLSVARELATLADDQRRAGVASGVDVARAQTQVAQDEFARAQANAALTAATLQLQRIVVLPLGAPLTLADRLAFQAQPLPDADSAVRSALARRQELAGLELTRQSRQLERDAARARRLPTAGLFADYGTSANTPTENDENTYTLGARVAMPIFSGGAISAGVRAAEADVNDAEIRLADARGQVEQDVRLALALAQAAAEQVRAAQSARELADRELTLARDRFTHGVTGNIEVVEAQGALARARVGYVDAVAAAAVAHANLAAALGDAAHFRLPAGAPAAASE